MTSNDDVFRLDRFEWRQRADFDSGIRQLSGRQGLESWIIRGRCDDHSGDRLDKRSTSRALSPTAAKLPGGTARESDERRARLEEGSDVRAAFGNRTAFEELTEYESCKAKERLPVFVRKRWVGLGPSAPFGAGRSMGLHRRDRFLSDYRNIATWAGPSIIHCFSKATVEDR